MKKIFVSLVAAFFITLIVISPELCIKGAKTGLLLCGNVIIPSLFPFTMCVLFIMRTEVMSKIKIIRPVAKYIFNQTSEMFCVMLFSMIGGYPVGARLINELVKSGKLSIKNAHIMQCFCVNAGPAFIAVAVGSGILHSKQLGIILLLSHLLASLLLALIFSKFFKRDGIKPQENQQTKITAAENFVISTADAANSVISICAFVILFSVINSYIKSIAAAFAPFKVLLYLCEVTTAATNTRNVLLISFLLGFSGFSVWFQVMASSGDTGVNFPFFSLGRILHGVLSTVITYLAVKICNITVPTVSNDQNFNFNYTASGVSVALALLVMMILLIISITSKNHSRKIISDML